MPGKSDRRRWAKYLVDERAEALVYTKLAARRTGEEREILLQLAAAEGRHEAHWLALLGGEPERLPRAGFRTRALGWMASRFGTIFVLALAQQAEARSPYDNEAYATAAMRADEKVHYEVVRGLAARGRRQISGTFRAAIFGANDGLVSNLALVMGIGAVGVSNNIVLFSGIAGLLAGALSMGAGEYISVRSQRELLESTQPHQLPESTVPALNLDTNELALMYRARGYSVEESEKQAHALIRAAQRGTQGESPATTVDESIGSAWSAALYSFLFFASGAIVPILPWLVGLSGIAAIVCALVLVGTALLVTGAAGALLSGSSPLTRAVRQLAIGFGAATVTYGLGRLFGIGLAE